MTTPQMLFKCSTLAAKIYAALEDLEDDHSPIEVCRAAGEALGIYTCSAGLRGQDGSEALTTFNNSLIVPVGEFIAKVLEQSMQQKRGPN